MFQKDQVSRLIFGVCFALLMGTTGTAAANGAISLEGEYWNPHVSGETKTTTNLDLKHDLGLGETNIVDLKLTYKGDHGPKYFIKYEKPNFKETENLTQSFNFGGGNYLTGDRVTSELDVKHLQFAVQNEKITSAGKFSMIYSYNHNSINTGIQNETQNFYQTKKNTSDSLSLGFGWESLNTKGVNCFLEATPLSIGARGSYLDYNMGIKTKLSKTTALTLGYRGERLEAGKTANSDGTTLNLRGMYVFIGSRF